MTGLESYSIQTIYVSVVNVLKLPMNLSYNSLYAVEQKIGQQQRGLVNPKRLRKMMLRTLW